MMNSLHKIKLVSLLLLYSFGGFSSCWGFLTQKMLTIRTTKYNASKDEPNSSENISDVLTWRLPTSVEDQVRQATESIKMASKDGLHRHNIRLLLPVIGATDLDDWPGGARQMMEAAYPLVKDIMKGLSGAREFQQILLDQSDGVYAISAQAEDPKNDSCSVLLPSAESLSALKNLEGQVGDKRDFIFVNPQWKRVSDFGGFFQRGDQQAAYVETYVPTFSLTNYICEGDSVRILRTYPGPWRVFVRNEDEYGAVDWVQVGKKSFIHQKPDQWSAQPENQRDGGRIFDFGMPSYQEIAEMLRSAPGYRPKNPAERAAAAFAFIKDSL